MRHSCIFYKILILHTHLFNYIYVNKRVQRKFSSKTNYFSSPNWNVFSLTDVEGYHT